MTEATSAPTSSLLLTSIFAVALMASMLLKFWLASRQIRHVATHRGAVPAAFAERITLESHHKAADYTIAQAKFGLLELAWSTVMTVVWTLLGGLSLLNTMLLQWLPFGLVQQVALLTSFMVVGAMLDLPFALYRTFVLEQRFGFNKMTVSLWFKDLLKSAVLGALIGLPIMTLVLWMMGATGSLWWLWTWGLWMGF